MRWCVVAVFAGLLAPLSAHAASGFCTMTANQFLDQTIYVSKIFTKDVIGAADERNFGAYVLGTVARGSIQPDHADPPYCRSYDSMAEAQRERKAAEARASPGLDIRAIGVNWP